MRSHRLRWQTVSKLYSSSLGSPAPPYSYRGVQFFFSPNDMTKWKALMITKIDWLSFTFPVGDITHPEHGWQAEAVRDELHKYIGDKLYQTLTSEAWHYGHGRPPFNQSAQMEGNLMTLYWSGRMNYALLEVAGRGMEWAREQGIERELLEVAAERVTRIDIASDIECFTLPSEFVNQSTSKRHHARASVVSKDGQTEYIGGRTSHRFARVYRYNEPHPRSKYLRVEHEVKKEAAKLTLQTLLDKGIEYVQSSLGQSFHWEHEDWKPEVNDAGKIKVPTSERSYAKTELWLRTSAAAAFRKLVKRGVITDPEAWLREVFIDPPTHR